MTNSTDQQMSIKEKLQQILADRARQEAEGARRRNEAWELSRVRLLAEEARKDAEIQRVQGILDSKGIPQMLEEDVLPLLKEMYSWAILGDVTGEDIIVHQKGQWERMQAIGVAIRGGGPYERHSGSYDNVKYYNARLGIFIETGVGTVHLCTGENNYAIAQFSLNDRNLKDKIESELAKILSEPKRFSWDNPDPYPS